MEQSWPIQFNRIGSNHVTEINIKRSKQPATFFVERGVVQYNIC